MDDEGLGIVCSCDYDSDGDHAVSWRAVERRAARAYRCIECDEAILQGERYESVSALWPGEGWSTFRTCRICAKIRATLAPCAAYGDLNSVLSEHLGVDLQGTELEDEE